MTPAARTVEPRRRPAEGRTVARRWVALAAALGVALGAVGAAGQPAEDPTPSSAERALLRRLLAPCCWRQSLDVHESDEAAELRREVHVRLSAGDSAQAIEEDLVRRYGDRVLAFSDDSDPAGVVPVIAGVAMAGMFFGLLAWVRQRRRDDRFEPRLDRGPASITGGADYDVRLDEELARQDR